MRLWSISPEYLDSKGLVALWRESLLAKAVFSGKTKGYQNHPQLIRFREHRDPLGVLKFYLFKVWEEADRRGYQFDRCKIGRGKKFEVDLIEIGRGQVEYEFKHLKRKLKEREPMKYEEIKGLKKIKVHPLFKIIEGEVAKWEKK